MYKFDFLMHQLMQEKHEQGPADTIHMKSESCFIWKKMGVAHLTQWLNLPRSPLHVIETQYCIVFDKCSPSE